MAIFPDCEVGESQDEREPHLDKREADRIGSMERVESTVKEDGFQGGEGRQAKRASLRELGESMSGRVDVKAPKQDLESLGFTPSLAKPEMGKEVGRRRANS